MTFYEKTDQLDGILSIAGAAVFKRDILDFLAHEERELRKAATQLRLSTRVMKEMIEAVSPNVLFIATGSRPKEMSDIPGLSRNRCVPPEDVYRRNIPERSAACVIGRGSVGCETSLYLALKV